MRMEDWRQVPASLIEPLYDAEARRWRLALDWDLLPLLDTIERARRAGSLPGIVLRGPGQSIHGWTYFVVQDGLVQIGSLLARTSDGIRLLLDGILRSPDASSAREIMFFGFPEGTGCESALARRRFDVTRYWYLRRPLEAATRPAADLTTALRRLCDADGPDAVRLLARAYQGQPAARCFAPNGRIDEWAHYFAHLTKGNALGTLVPDATLVAAGPSRQPMGLAITTAVGPSTLHLAQLVVDPSLHRRGLGGQLLDAAMSWGTANGQRLITLLVNDHHRAALELYASRQFLPAGSFLYGRRAMLRKRFDQVPAVPPRGRAEAPAPEAGL